MHAMQRVRAVREGGADIMAYRSLFHILRRLLVACQKFRDIDNIDIANMMCDGPGSEECLDCKYLKEAANDALLLIIESLGDSQVLTTLRGVIQ